MYALLGVCCALDYEKAVAVRLGATTAGTLLYFRNTALVRLMAIVVTMVKTLLLQCCAELTGLPWLF